MKVCGIYKITSPSGKVYIGQSVNIEKRFSDYRAMDCKRQIKLYNSLYKYGVDSHFFEIVEEVSKDKLCERERSWQDFHCVIGEKGLNCILIGANEVKAVYSVETRKKMSTTWLGRTHSLETRMLMSKNRKGRKLSEEHKAKLKGKTQSQETKDKRSRKMIGRVSPMKGRKHSLETRLKISRPCSEEKKEKMRGKRSQYQQSGNARADSKTKITPHIKFITSNIGILSQKQMIDIINIKQSTLSKFIKKWKEKR